MTNTESRLQAALLIAVAAGAPSAVGEVDDTSDVGYFEMLMNGEI